MYEENLEPLPPGDATSVFADVLTTIQQPDDEDRAKPITPDNVVRWARKDIQPAVARIGRRLLLPGSGIVGVENLSELADLASKGSSGIICLNHRSNLDVPTLYVLLHDQDKSDLFQQIIWITGRKLQEDAGLTPKLIQSVNRVIVTPTSWLKRDHSETELHTAHQVNMAAHRAIHDLRTQGWLFGLFPAGTRMRPGDKSTARAIEEIDSYLKNFEFMVLARIDGCTLPVARDDDLTHETPKLDRMVYTFGAVQRTSDWRADAARRWADLEQRAASATAIMQDIDALSGEPAD